VTNPLAASVAARESSNAALATATNDVSSKFTKQHLLPILGGRFVLNLNQVPLWGSPDAPAKLVSMYDYTCHHCREMHPHVAELRRTFGDQLAIISLPMPLDAQCNPLMRQTPRPHLNACTYARLGLIVWRAKHRAIEEFDHWLFSFPNPPPLTAVTNKALELVGVMAFDAASRDPWIEEQLRTDIDIYTVNGREFKQDKMPQFIVGSNIISGPLTADQLRGFVAPHISAR
jgi:hypothetical protein